MSDKLRRQVATLVSNVLNPFLVSLVAILALSLAAASRPAEAIRWSVILAAVCILPVLAAVGYLAHRHQVEGIFTSQRRQRTRVYLLAGVCAIVGGILLVYLGAPLLLRSAFVAGVVAIAIFTLINLWWKISVHTAFVSALVTILVVLYGVVAAPAVALVLLVGWSRIELRQHSLAQVIGGALLVALVLLVVFRLYGLV